MDIETRFFSAGVPLEATLHLPNEGNEDITEGNWKELPEALACVTKKYPVIILCHGGSRSRNDGLDALADYLGKMGYASFRFDFAGCGQRAQNPMQLRMCTEMPYNLTCAIYYLESLPCVDRNRIGIVGISMGAALTIQTLGKGENRIKSAVSIAASINGAYNRKRDWGDRFDEIVECLKEDARIAAATGQSQIINRAEVLREKTWGSRKNVMEGLLLPEVNTAYITMESLLQQLSFESLSYMYYVQCPIFIAHGEEDQAISIDNAEMLYEAVPESVPKKLKIYSGIDHNMMIHKKRKELFEDIVVWFQETLGDEEENKQPERIDLKKEREYAD